MTQDVKQVDNAVDQQQEQEKQKKITENLVNMRKSLEDKDQRISGLEEELNQIKRTLQPQAPQHNQQQYEREALVDYGSMEEFYEKKKRAEEEANFAYKLREKYSDFSEVVTPNSVKELEKEDPEEARLISKLPSKYDQGLAAYKWLKRNEKAMALQQERELNKKKLIENEDKPQNVPTSSNSGSTNTRKTRSEMSGSERRAYNQNLWQKMGRTARKA